MKRIVFILLFISNFLVHSESLKVGILQFAPPFSSKSDKANHYYGFVVALMNIICNRLQEKCEYIPITNEGELKGLDRGTFDIVFSSTPITTSLPDNYRYSLPYLTSDGQFLTLKNNSINTLNDINFKKIGFFKINFHQSPLLKKYQTTNTLIEFTDPAELVNALTAKEIDAILINYQASRFIVNNLNPAEDNQLKLIGDKIPIGSGYGIIALKNQSALIDKINRILLEMEKDGSYLHIYNEYFGANSVYNLHH
ncbi:transporter substrate-binding domain-containing protein [Legionella pneumophila]|uniref:transporter substrate-binding domain-containing protein n=2 Tax=Legionella pneumophila TaxID=446 RepID=UPI00048C3E3B|nr:transporter substrate-binding domain-containing protein [Legionella pneumophila]RYW30181.1 ABC transporter substrate-binding protein [Legionella pneumophila]HAT1866658.1 transporter substrate-binding domain-containing protein [Legionella pneumophila]HAT1906785.1 transporter substrate-binding domain-containing protein [Legionella pneumophila]HAT1915543.1 transporter substrate-binding domain-containing protein [Legionella pneumophila]HAT1985612.1 transporter substrate-binding domain-containin